MFEQFAGQPGLATAWFLVIGFFWIGYVVLDGFDLGVGMLMGRIFARDDREQRVLLNTIGPVWDGNEVWLITAGGALFAAFPEWYATMFSGFYLPLFLILLALIVRIVGLEWRKKVDDPVWRRRCDAAIIASQSSTESAIGFSSNTGMPASRAGSAISRWLNTGVAT